ncbi:WD repeat-containing protein 74 [Cryptosporidium felis]|nr:WD repeat-containing protein 74 [Cryptosporidium felis]
MNYLYSGDSLGVVKEYDMDVIFSSNSSNTESVIKYCNGGIKKVTYIYISGKTSINENKGNNKDMLIGYSDGTICLVSVPFRANLNTPKIIFKVSGEIIFLEDISSNYLNKYDEGNIILAVTGSMKLYILKLPQIKAKYEHSQSIIDITATDAYSIYSDLIMKVISIPCNNLKCIAYNRSKNSIAFGGYESDVRLLNINTYNVYWSSRNIQFNGLKHRIPVDVTKVLFLRENPEILLCGTGNGELRLYAPRLQKRPIINYEIWEEKSPITSLTIIKESGKLLSNKNSNGCIFAVGNNIGSVVLFKLTETKEALTYKVSTTKPQLSALIKKRNVSKVGKIVPLSIFGDEFESDDPISSNKKCFLEISPIGNFKGIMGGVTVMKSKKFNLDDFKDCNVLIIGGLGRYIYFFEVKKRKLIKKIFTSQKTTFIALL